MAIRAVDGRDISDFSLYPNEQEVILLPNSVVLVQPISLCTENYFEMSGSTTFLTMIQNPTEDEKLLTTSQLNDTSSLECCLYCPITNEMFNQPVVASDGRTYEKAALEVWIRRNNVTSPSTGDPMPNPAQFLPNHAISTILKLVDKRKIRQLTSYEITILVENKEKHHKRLAEESENLSEEVKQRIKRSTFSVKRHRAAIMTRRGKKGVLVLDSGVYYEIYFYPMDNGPESYISFAWRESVALALFDAEVTTYSGKVKTVEELGIA